MVSQKELIGNLRTQLKTQFPETWMGMVEPHITHLIGESREEAEAAKLHVESFLPFNVTITGFTIE